MRTEVNTLTKQSLMYRYLEKLGINGAIPATVGIVLIVLISLLALVGPYIVPNDPYLVKLEDRLQSPSYQYPLGTDHFGRCVFSRLIEGARQTLGITLWVLATVAIIGIPLGILSGYSGGRLDAFLMRFADGLVALPDFILAVAIAGFLGPSLSHVTWAIVIVKWVGYARLVRGIVLSEREQPYVLAAVVSGTRTWKIILRHLLPQVTPAVTVYAAMDIGKIILTISALSYLGLGAQPPMPEWGAMLSDARPYFQTVPSLMIYPGAAIFFVVLACNLMSDGLRDVWDLQQKSSM